MTDSLTPQRVEAGRYQVQRTLGRGGMAVVSLAEDTLLGRQVALKTLQPAYAYDKAFVERFRREAQAAARLGHPNIVRIYDLLESPEGTPVIVMEYVPGPSLQDALRRAGRPPLSLALAIVRQASAALQEAHRQGLVHRDVKPGNLLLTHPLPTNDWHVIPVNEDDTLVKVVDFGIARAAGERSLSMAGEVWGSAHYLSPEQARGEAATAASDVYALGCVLFELLTGRPPFQGEGAMAVALQHIDAPPPSPRSLDATLPHSIDQVVLRALAKDPTQRFSSAQEFGDALRLVEDLGLEATGPLTVARRQVAPRSSPSDPDSRDAPTEPTPAGPRRRRRSVSSWLLAIAFALALAAVSPWAVQFGRPWIESRLVSQPPATAATTIVMPQVEGMPVEQARAQLEMLGLTVQLGPALFSNSVAAGSVLQQDPTPGVAIKQGSTVTLTASLGRQTIAVPSLVGSRFADAFSQLLALGLLVERRDTPRPQAAPEAVVGQEPAPGTSVPAGSTVVLLVNAGGLTAVPELHGKTEAEARKLIEAAGLRIPQFGVNYQSRKNTDIPPGQLRQVCLGCVLSSSPGAGTAVQLGSDVRLAVRDPADED